jgi:hypothetical protein
MTIAANGRQAMPRLGAVAALESRGTDADWLICVERLAAAWVGEAPAAGVGFGVTDWLAFSAGVLPAFSPVFTGFWSTAVEPLIETEESNKS